MKNYLQQTCLNCKLIPRNFFGFVTGFHKMPSKALSAPEVMTVSVGTMKCLGNHYDNIPQYSYLGVEGAVLFLGVLGDPDLLNLKEKIFRVQV